MYQNVHALYAVSITKDFPLKAATYVNRVLIISKIPVKQTPIQIKQTLKSTFSLLIICSYFCALIWIYCVPADVFRRQYAFWF